MRKILLGTLASACLAIEPDMLVVYARWYIAATLSLLLGVLAGFGMPPYDAITAWIGAHIVFLLLVAHAQTFRLSILIISVFSLAYTFTVGYWIYNALLASPRELHFLLPFTYLPLALTDAPLLLVSALVFGLLHRRQSPTQPWLRAFIMVLLLWAAAWMRQVLPMGGAPWLTPGILFPAGSPMSQSASLIGVLGLDAVVLSITLSITLFLIFWNQKSAHRLLSTILLLSFALSVIGGNWWFGTDRLGHAEQLILAPSDNPNAPIRATPSFELRIVQPNVQQRLVQDINTIQMLYNKQIAMSKTAGDPSFQPQVIIWPESSLPLSIRKDNPVISDISKRVTPDGGYVFAGTLLESQNRFTNVIVAIDDRESMVAHYSKKHLVPFGEYVPFENIFPMVQSLGLNLRSLGRGDGSWQGSDRMKLPPSRALICFESIFSLEMGDTRNLRWILNVSNDGWFGDSAGPHQHLAITSYRAIEHGLPLVRSAITGISAVIDSFGRETARLPLNTEGVIDTRLPPALAPTVWITYGPMLAVLAGFLLFGTLFLMGFSVVPSSHRH